MDPIRRLESQLHPEGEAEHNASGQQDDEHGRPVAGISETIVEPALVASRGEFEKALEQLPFAALRTFAEQGGAGGERLGHLLPVVSVNSDAT